MRLLALLLISATAVAAESDDNRRAREELEAELQQLVAIPDPEVTVFFEGFEEPPYEVSGLELSLDGAPLPVGAITKLNKPGTTTLWHGKVSRGQHVLVARAQWTDTSNMMFSETAGFTWRVTSRATFTAERGLDTQVTLLTEHTSANGKEQFQLRSRGAAVMLAAVETAPRSPPVVDAGTSLTRDAGVEPTTTRGGFDAGTPDAGAVVTPTDAVVAPRQERHAEDQPPPAKKKKRLPPPPKKLRGSLLDKLRKQTSKDSGSGK